MYVSFVSPLNSASFFIKTPAALQEWERERVNQRGGKAAAQRFFISSRPRIYFHSALAQLAQQPKSGAHTAISAELLVNNLSLIRGCYIFVWNYSFVLISSQF
jgi:hypothetical protein